MSTVLDPQRAKNREKARRCYWRNREKALARASAWRAANQDLVKQVYRTAYERYKNDPAYLKKARQRAAAWYAINRDIALAHMRAQYAANPEKQRKAVRAYRQKNLAAVQAREAAYRAQPENIRRAVERAMAWARANPERRRKIAARWRKQHPAFGRLARQCRRARKLAARGYATVEQIEARVAYYGGKCAYCGGPYEHLDHVVPLSRGGTEWPANFRPACKQCNLSKNNKSLTAWRRGRRLAHD